MTTSLKKLFAAATLAVPLSILGVASGHSHEETAVSPEAVPLNFIDHVYTAPLKDLDESAKLLNIVMNNIRYSSLMKPDIHRLGRESITEIFNETPGCRGARPSIPREFNAKTIAPLLIALDKCASPEPVMMKMTEEIIKNLTARVDPYTNYMPPAEAQKLRENMSGLFGGIGVLINAVDEGLAVIDVNENGPADRAGILPGDTITHIEGVPLAGKTAQEMPELRGAVNAPVNLTLQRGNQTLQKRIVRAVIEDNPVRSHMIGDDIAYIQLRHFLNARTTYHVSAAINELQRDHGNKIRGYILDLRYNGGGLTIQAEGVAGLFLDGGRIMSTGTGDPDRDRSYDARPGDMIGGLPLTVMINEFSASASELVAAALQDQGRAHIVGTQSYGKGSVQSVMPLPNGGIMRLTTQLYFSPSGHSLQGRGVMPDTKFVPLTPPEEAPERAPAFESLPDHITYDTREPSTTCTPRLNDPVRHTQKELIFRDGSVDYKLICAVEQQKNRHIRTVRRPLSGPSV